MKKLIVAVILAVVLTLTFATPAFAGPPEDKPGNMPDEGIAGLEKALDKDEERLGDIGWCLPIGFSLSHRQVWPAACRPSGSWLAYIQVSFATLQGCPPGQVFK